MKRWSLLLLCLTMAFSSLTACSILGVVTGQSSEIDADKIDWDNIVLSTVLPEPQSDLMSITLNDKNALQADIYKISTNEFLEYIRLCEDEGFDIDANRGGSTLFSASHEDGYSLTLTYSKTDDKMTINLIQSTGSGSTVSVPPADTDSKLDAEEIYDRCASAVFYIEIYDRYGTAIASGSGVFISEDGIALTNHHVVKDAYSAAIMTNDGKIYDVSGYYDAQSSIDMALIQVDGTGFPHLTMDDSGNLTAGQTVFAIGSPKGLDDTISQGIISNANRVLDGLSYIQMTAPISSGSSGGALINDQGLLIGLNTATYLDAQNLNLAVPIHLYRDLSDNTLYSFPLSSGGREYTGAYLSFNTSLNITAGNTGTVTIFADPGTYTGGVSILWDDADESIVTPQWSEWDGWYVDLIIDALTPGSTTITISLLTDDDKVLAQEILYVTVSGSSSNFGSGNAYLSFYPLLDVTTGSTEVVTIYADPGSYTGDVTIRYDGADESIIQASWDEWIDWSISLYIYGMGPGVAEFDISLVTEDGTVLASEVMTVVVSDRTSYYGASLYFTEYQYTSVGETLSVFIQSDRGTFYGDTTLLWNCADTDIVSLEWGSYDPLWGTYLYATANSPGTAEVIVSLISTDGEVLASETLLITVFG